MKLPVSLLASLLAAAGSAWAVNEDPVISEATAFAAYALSVPEDGVSWIRSNVEYPECLQPEFSIYTQPNRLGRFVLSVHCSNGAKRYLRGRLISEGSIVTLRRPMQRGSVIGKEDLTGGDKARSFMGMSVRRSLPAGHALTERDVEAPTVLKRGAEVDVSVMGQGFRILKKGTLLQDAGVGERVPVRISRRETVYVVVQPDGSTIFSP